MATNDFLKAGNFIMQLRDQRKIEFTLQEVNLPGFQMGEMPMPAPMVQQERRPGDHIQWNNLTMNCIADEDMESWNEAMKYILLAKNPETGDLNIDEIYFDGYLHITTNKNNISHSYKFYNCWISVITDLQLTSTSSEDEAPTFTIEIVYTHFKIDPTEEKKTALGIS